MKLGFNPTLSVEASIVDDDGAAQPLAGQTFYISEKDPEGILRGNDLTNEIGYARAMNALRNHSLTFVITDSQGKDEKTGLKAGTYYICGIGHTQQGVVIWNVAVELKAGKNRLVLDNTNLVSVVRA